MTETGAKLLLTDEQLNTCNEVCYLIIVIAAASDPDKMRETTVEMVAMIAAGAVFATGYPDNYHKILDEIIAGTRRALDENLADAERNMKSSSIKQTPIQPH